MNKSTKFTLVVKCILNFVTLLIGLWFLYPLYENNSRLLWGLFFLMWSNNLSLREK
jgi:hypothetical protein